MKLSIIILNYNTKDLTESCIDSIIKNTKGIDYEIIVIDNGSLEKLPNSKNYKLIANKTNPGFAGGNNSARKIAKGDYILFLNSDTEVHGDTIKEALKYISNNPKFGAFICKNVLPCGLLYLYAYISFPS